LSTLEHVQVAGLAWNRSGQLKLLQLFLTHQALLSSSYTISQMLSL
jgi:hypothetical protein